MEENDTVVSGVIYVGGRHSQSEAPRLNLSGRITVSGSTYAGIPSIPDTLFQSSAGGASPWRIVARVNDPAPGLTGYTINEITRGTFVQADSGAVIWNGIAKPATGSNVAAVWLDGGTSQLLGREGGIPSGSAEVFNSALGYTERIRISNQGLPLMMGAVRRGNGYAEALLSGLPGQFGIVALGGEPFQGAPSGEVFGGVSSGSSLNGGFLSLMVSASGHIAFGNKTFIPGSSAFHNAVWTKAPGKNTSLRQFGPLATASRIPDQGRVLGNHFIALRGLASNTRLLLEQDTAAGNPEVYGAALFQSDSAGTMTFAAGWPGSIGGNQADFPNRDLCSYSASGIMASYFRIPAANQGSVRGYGLATGTGSNWTMVALNNTQAPGLPAGVKYKLNEDHLSSDLSRLKPALTPLGRLLFVTRLQGAGVTSANDKALWIAQPGGLPRLVLRTGQSVTSSRFTRTVSDFVVATHSGGDDGLPRAHNDSGQIVVDIVYPSGSGIWLASAGATVPAGDLPTIRVTRSGNTCTLSWTTTLTGLVPESSPNLMDPWQPITATPVKSGNNYTLAITSTPDRNFFRLRKP